MILDWIPKETALAVETLDLSLTVKTVPEIDGLLSKTVLFRGKKFRPTLCFLMGQLLKIPLEKIAPYSRAAEFVHAATLAHDDVIDESQTRRNRPTLNARSSNARAVLAGDLLLARVMCELSALGEIKIIHDLSQTVEDLVHGEWLQLEARRIANVDRHHLEMVAKKKTASLMIWCCTAPVRLSKLEDRLFEVARQLGESLGVAFQMIDDIIDYDTAGEKPFAQDIREGLVNFVTLEMIENNPSLVEPIQKMLGNDTLSSPLPWKNDELQLASDRVRARAQAKLEVADQSLSQISKSLVSLDSEAHRSLRGILVYLKERVR